MHLIEKKTERNPFCFSKVLHLYIFNVVIFSRGSTMNSVYCTIIITTTVTTMNRSCIVLEVIHSTCSVTTDILSKCSPRRLLIFVRYNVGRTPASGASRTIPASSKSMNSKSSGQHCQYTYHCQKSPNLLCLHN